VSGVKEKRGCGERNEPNRSTETSIDAVPLGHRCYWTVVLLQLRGAHSVIAGSVSPAERGMAIPEFWEIACFARNDMIVPSVLGLSQSN